MKVYTLLHKKQTLHHGKNVIQYQFVKRSKTGLNSEFSFSYNDCITKPKRPGFPVYLPIAWKDEFMLFPNNKYDVMKCSQPRPGIELGSLIPFRKMRSVTQSTLLEFRNQRILRIVQVTFRHSKSRETSPVNAGAKDLHKGKWFDFFI